MTNEYYKIKERLHTKLYNYCNGDESLPLTGSMKKLNALCEFTEGTSELCIEHPMFSHVQRRLIDRIKYYLVCLLSDVQGLVDNEINENQTEHTCVFIENMLNLCNVHVQEYNQSFIKIMYEIKVIDIRIQNLTMVYKNKQVY